MLLLFVSFLAGVLTVLAPCTISLLPVIVGGSIGDGHNRMRSFVVTLSLGVSVFVFTLILKWSTLFINIPQAFWQIFSGVIIFLIGFVMLFPAIWERIPFLGKINLGGNRLLATGYKKHNMTGDIIMGASLGPVFSSCSPTYFLILATILPKSLGAGIVYLLAYILGLCGFLLIISILSQKAIQKLGMTSDSRSYLKRGIGVIFLCLGLAIIFGLDQKIELFVSGNIYDITKIEQKLLEDRAEPSAIDSASSKEEDALVEAKDTAERIKDKSRIYDLAPEITNPTGFVNTDGKPITFSEFKGKKVVLVDFWTYSCINCQRTTPYLNAWYEKYSDEGLEIVSIHTPEFAFEKVLKNVEAGVKRFGIKYPVVLDSDYGTWSAFRNSYWPRKYLIDIDGFIVYDHAGEGDYDVTEKEIQKALAERAKVLDQEEDTKVSGGIVAPLGAIQVNNFGVNSPETYFGSGRNEYFANGKTDTNGMQSLTAPENISLNKLYLAGDWNFSDEYAETKDAGAKIIYKYDAKDIYFVASSVAGAKLKLTLDGKPVKASIGADVGADGTVLIKENRLYKIVEGDDYGKHTLEIEIINGVLDAYTFTFG